MKTPKGPHTRPFLLGKGFAKQKIAGRVWNVDNGLSIEQPQKSGGKSRERNSKQLVKTLSTFPPSAASVQQLCSIFPRWRKSDTASENAGHKIVTILFFYPDTISYICINQLKRYTYERTTSDYRLPILPTIQYHTSSSSQTISFQLLKEQRVRDRHRSFSCHHSVH